MKKLNKSLVLAVSLLPSIFADAQSLSPSAPTISGLANFRYSYDSGDDSHHGFDIRRVRLSAAGDLSPRLDYKVQAEYETSVKVIDAYARVKIAKPFNIQVGEFKVPYSQETLYGPASWLTIENPAAVAKLNGYQDLAGLKANGRDVGLLLYGDAFLSSDSSFRHLSYKVGVFNGNGINVKDNNNQKDFALLLFFRPAKPLTISFGQYVGHYGESGSVEGRNRTSAGIEYKGDRFTFRSEYLHGKTAGKKSDGVYAHAAFQANKVFQPLLSYDFFKPDADNDEKQSNFQAGLNITPIKHVRVQLAYTLKHYEVASDVHQVEAQALFQF